MNFDNLRFHLLKYPVFTDNDALKWFPEEKLTSFRVQISRWLKEKKLLKLKKGTYLLAEKEVADRFVLAPILAKPSYLSLETALNSLGIIPDIPQAVTSITTNKTCQFKTAFGIFIYHQIKKELFFGYTKVLCEPFIYFIAQPEKAVLDYLYLKAKGVYPQSLKEIRFTLDKDFNWKRFYQYADDFKDSQKIIKDFLKRFKP